MSTEQYTPLPPLPRKRVAAGALFLNQAGQILLVNPTYKPPWEIPGGMVEENEAPLTACRREILEEIGLTIAPGRLLSVGYLHSHHNRGDAIRFIFWGGKLDSTQIAEIQLQASELSEYRFVTLDEAATLVRPSLHAQLAQCLANVEYACRGNDVECASATTYWEEASQLGE